MRPFRANIMVRPLRRLTLCLMHNHRRVGASPEIHPAKVRGGIVMTSTAIAGSVHIMDALENGDQALSLTG